MQKRQRGEQDGADTLWHHNQTEKKSTNISSPSDKIKTRAPARGEHATANKLRSNTPTDKTQDGTMELLTGNICEGSKGYKDTQANDYGAKEKRTKISNERKRRKRSSKSRKVERPFSRQHRHDETIKWKKGDSKQMLP